MASNIPQEAQTNVAQPKDMRGIRVGTGDIPANMAWSPKKAANALKADYYLRIGNGTNIGNRALSGAEKIWKANPQVKGNENRGLDILYIDKIQINEQYADGSQGQLKNYTLRVSADPSRMVQFLTLFGFASSVVHALRIIGAFAISSVIMHGEVGDVPRAGLELLAGKGVNRYKAMENIYTEQYVAAALSNNNFERVKKLRSLYTNQINERKNKSARVKSEKGKIDLNLFVFLSKKISDAQIEDQNGAALTRGARGCGGRSRTSIITKFEELLQENTSGANKVLNVSDYIPGKWKVTKGVNRAKTARTTMVPFDVTYKGSVYKNLVFTNNGDSVNDVLSEISEGTMPTSDRLRITQSVESGLAEIANRSKNNKKDKRPTGPIDVSEVTMPTSPTPVVGGAGDVSAVAVHFPGWENFSKDNPGVILGGGQGATSPGANAAPTFGLVSLNSTNANTSSVTGEESV